MPKNKGHYPDIPEGNISLTNRELELLRKKYGNAVLEPDEVAAGGLEEPAADLAPEETGNAAAGNDTVPAVSAEPEAAAQDPLPELEPEPVSEEEPDPVDDTPADYSAFFAGADELLEELSPEAAAEAFARYIGGLSFDTHRGAMTAETEWPGLLPAAAPKPSDAVAQPLPAGTPDRGGAKNKRTARAKKPSFLSGRKARGALSRSLNPAADAQEQSGGSEALPAADPDDTGLATAVDLDEPAGLAQPLPAQNEPEVPVETVTDTDELDFTKKYLGYSLPADPGGNLSAAQVKAQNGGEDTPIVPVVAQAETAAEESLPAEESIVETVLIDEDVANPASVQGAPETPAADSAPKQPSFWEKRKQRKALKAESVILPAQPPAEPVTAEPSPENPAEEIAFVDGTDEISASPEASEPLPLPEPPAEPEETAQEAAVSSGEPAGLPAQEEAPAPAEENVPATQEPIGEPAEFPAQDEAPAPAQDIAPEVQEPIVEADSLPVQAAAPAEENTADAAAPEPHDEIAAQAQEPSAEAGEEAAEVPEDTDESDLANTVSGEALAAEKPPAENIRPQTPLSQPQSAPNAGMRIIYRAPEAAALDADNATAEPAGDQSKGKTGPAGVSPYQKYIRVIYQAPGGTFLDESEAAQPEASQTAPAENTAPQTPEPEGKEISSSPAGEEGAAAPADTAQEAAAEEKTQEAAEPPSSDETQKAEAVAQMPDGEKTPEGPGGEQAPGDGILAELAAEKKHSRFKRFLRAFFPQRGDSAAEKIRKSVLVLATLTILVCGGILLNSHVIEPAMSNRQIAKAIELKKNSSLDKNWPDIQSKYTGVTFPQGMLPRYAGLYVANRDFSGWLTIEGLGIDMPLVQGETNGDYLRTDFYGKPSRYGCCFFDYRNTIQTLNRNTIVYGHNMGSSDLLMFGNLEKYSRVEGFKAAPVIECNTLYTLMKWKVYAVFVTNALPSQDNGYLFNYIFPEMENDEDFAEYISQLDRRKLYTTGVELLKSDKILTLSTCSYEFDDARLVVVARLVRPGESEKVDTALAAVNPSPKYPQIWYTKNGQTNPYQDDEKWYP